MTKPTIKITPILFIDPKFEKGQYWIGDLCYIYPDDFWSDYVEEAFEGTNGRGKDWQGAILEYNGIKVFTCNTCYGDGCYPVRKNGQVIGQCGVDAGMLSLVPVSLAQTWPEWKEKKELGIIIDVEKDFTIEVFGEQKRKGNWRFLDYDVITDYEEGGEEDNEEEELDDGYGEYGEND